MTRAASARFSSHRLRARLGAVGVLLGLVLGTAVAPAAHADWDLYVAGGLGISGAMESKGLET